MVSDQNKFLSSRVVNLRGQHLVNYEADSDIPNTAIVMACAETGMAVYLLPVIAGGLVFIEAHGFMNGERHHIDSTPTNSGGVELTMRKKPA